MSTNCIYRLINVTNSFSVGCLPVLFAKHNRLIVVAVMVMAFSPLSVVAQFFRINIVIPPTTEQVLVKPFDMVQRSGIESGMEVLDGNAVLQLSGAENIQVQARLVHSGSLRNAAGHMLPLVSTLAYRNDGQSEPPGTIVGRTATFPLSDSGRVIRYMKGYPAVLNAYLFVSVQAAIPLISTSPYKGNVQLIIEYN